MKVWVWEYESDIVVLVYLCDSKGKDKLGKSQFFLFLSPLHHFLSAAKFETQRQNDTMGVGLHVFFEET